MNYINFFFNDTATTEIYTLSLHDALPIWGQRGGHGVRPDPRRRRDHAGGGRGNGRPGSGERLAVVAARADRKSTRLNSSHANISYAVFCLKKNKQHLVAVHHHMPELELVD